MRTDEVPDRNIDDNDVNGRIYRCQKMGTDDYIRVVGCFRDINGSNTMISLRDGFRPPLLNFANRHHTSSFTPHQILQYLHGNNSYQTFHSQITSISIRFDFTTTYYQPPIS